jgi:hypothetical protein
MSPRRNWDPPVASECAPPPRNGGRAHSPAGEGLGESNSDDWRISSLLLCALRVQYVLYILILHKRTTILFFLKKEKHPKPEMGCQNGILRLALFCFKVKIEVKNVSQFLNRKSRIIENKRYTQNNYRPNYLYTLHSSIIFSYKFCSLNFFVTFSTDRNQHKILRFFYF